MEKIISTVCSLNLRLLLYPDYHPTIVSELTLSRILNLIVRPGPIWILENESIVNTFGLLASFNNFRFSSQKKEESFFAMTNVDCLVWPSLRRLCSGLEVSSHSIPQQVDCSFAVCGLSSATTEQRWKVKVPEKLAAAFPSTLQFLDVGVWTSCRCFTDSRFCVAHLEAKSVGGGHQFSCQLASATTLDESEAAFPAHVPSTAGLVIPFGLSRCEVALVLGHGVDGLSV